MLNIKEILEKIEDCGEGAEFLDSIPESSKKDLKSLVHYLIENIDEDDISKVNYISYFTNRDEAKMFLDAYLTEAHDFLKYFNIPKEDFLLLNEYKKQILKCGYVSNEVMVCLHKSYMRQTVYCDDVFSFIEDCDSLHNFIDHCHILFNCSTENMEFFKKVMKSFYNKLVANESSSGDKMDKQMVIDKVEISKTGTAVVRVKVGDNQYKINQFHNEVVNDLVKQTKRVQDIMKSFNGIKPMAGRTARRHFKALVEGVPVQTLH